MRSGTVATASARGGRIVEDWTAVDSLELLRRLSFVRALLAAPTLLGATRR